jgi:hypothetical protein
LLPVVDAGFSEPSPAYSRAGCAPGRRQLGDGHWQSQDTRAAKGQDYGIKITNPGGKYLVTDNDCTSNINSQGINPHGPISGPTLWIKDNLGDDLV